jgi:hypothetical protein
MGKLDDMRRLREQQFADGQKRRTSPRPPEPAAPRAPAPPGTPAPAAAAADAPEPAEDEGPAQPTRPTRAAKAPRSTSPKKKSGSSAEDHGTCPACGKVKPLAGGVLAGHQKGLGKACPGSRQKPA